jgi:hypothetical protein
VSCVRDIEVFLTGQLVVTALSESHYLLHLSEGGEGEGGSGGRRGAGQGIGVEGGVGDKDKKGVGE